MVDLHTLVMPVLRLLPPETSHRLAIRALSWGLGPRDRRVDPPILTTAVWGLEFRNPIGLAAGFDKGAEAPDAMLAAGFGFVEAGTVTPLPQPGNPRPRLFRLGLDGAVINRMGFNGSGLAPFLKRIETRSRDVGPFGVNAGRNKDTGDAVGDYETIVEAVTPWADYIVLNISSPNTPGLRRLQDRDLLPELLERVMAARKRSSARERRMPAILVKMSPDLEPRAREELADIILQAGVDGLTVANTTVARPKQMCDPKRNEAGGLSGTPLFPIALDAVRDMYRLVEGQIPIVGCGGVSTGEQAYEMIRSGASLVQIYTALVFHGPGLIPRLKEELACCLDRDGFTSVSEAVGVDVSLPGARAPKMALVA